MLAGGGNAVDAAVAAGLVLAVVAPYYCGLGGDLLALVWDDGPTGVLSAEAAPAGATPDALRAAVADGHARGVGSVSGTGGMPARGALSVTVPGAVAGWFHLLERLGTRDFADLARAALALADDGFEVSPMAGGLVDASREALSGQPGWQSIYGRMRPGRRFVQPELAASLRILADEGPAAMYEGRLGEAVVAALARHGSAMRLDDLAAHEVTEVAPLSGRIGDLEVLELPPPTQGVTALTALGVLDHLDPVDDPALAVHRRVEAVRAALADRQQHLADPGWMRTTPSALLARHRLAAMAAGIDPDHAAAWPPGRPAPGGTAYLCAADGGGLLVSLIQSNFQGFGSGVVADGTGICLHNRGAHFGLEADDVNAIAPGKRPMHTLIPALALRDGAPWLVFGTMGGDGQPQTHVLLLGHLLDGGLDVQAAIAAPRWVVDVADGSVAVEADLDPVVVRGLTRCGHRVRQLPARAHLAGHAHAVGVAPDGYVGGSDPRCEGALRGV